MRELSAVVGVTLLLASIASAEEAGQTLREISWSTLEADGALAGGEVLPPDDQDSFEKLRIVNANDEPFSVTILTIEDPDVGGPAYAITGQVSYQDVQGTGFLEMWSFFPDGGMYFSRTLGDFGPLGSLRGSSGWRVFTLPFYLQESPAKPNKLVVNVVLPGRGTVFLGPLRLVQYAPGEDLFALPGQWWSDRTSGLIGGLMGVMLGGLGTLIGVLVSKGKARRFVLGALKAMVLFGAVMLILGVIALARSQPYCVYFPLFLAGLLCTVIPGGLLGTAARRYEELELRKMTALDAS